MVEITEIECPICNKGKIKIAEYPSYFSSRKGFVGKRVNFYVNGRFDVLNNCNNCNATIREIKDKL